MKDKITASSAQPALQQRKKPHAQPALQQRKKPHALPPLAKIKNSEGSTAEPRPDSPIPQWRRSSLAEADARPTTRLKRCPGAVYPQSSVHISSKYAPLDPIKRRIGKQMQ